MFPERVESGSLPLYSNAHGAETSALLQAPSADE
jgi:hypothetical protein